jgi:DNA-binding YbaB/EbfC family protein
MNMQALMKQAQSLQKDLEKVQKEIDSTEFEGESSIVKVKAKGDKSIVSITIDKSASLESDDLEMLEDMLMVAINNAFEKIDDFKEKKLSKYGNIPGLF